MERKTGNRRVRLGTQLTSFKDSSDGRCRDGYTNTERGGPQLFSCGHALPPSPFRLETFFTALQCELMFACRSTGGNLHRSYGPTLSSPAPCSKLRRLLTDYLSTYCNYAVYIHRIYTDVADRWLCRHLCTRRNLNLPIHWSLRPAFTGLPFPCTARAC